MMIKRSTLIVVSLFLGGALALPVPKLARMGDGGMTTASFDATSLDTSAFEPMPEVPADNPLLDPESEIVETQVERTRPKIAKAETKKKAAAMIKVPKHKRAR